ncbi:MAG: glycosyltransferase family 2 protein [Firmicutes bacterium]|nr:glycosyltransferase family 2 protein [Bacillota bacterium]
MSKRAENVPDADIIIVTYNSAGDIVRCLDSILRQETRYRYQVTVVDNASIDGTSEIIKLRFPEVRLLISDRNLGFAGANNLAVGQTYGQHVVFLNPDTEVKSGALDELLDFLRAHPEVGAVGPKLLNADGTLQLTGNTFPALRNLLFETLFLDRLFPKTRLFGAHKLSFWDRQQPGPVDWVMGACIALPRAVGDKVGWFKEDFFMYFEETDFCRRLRGSGYRVYYVPSAEVVHFGGAGFEAYSASKVVMWHRSLLRYFERHHPEKIFWLRLLILFRSFLRSGLWLILSLRFGRFALLKSIGYLKTIWIMIGGGK